MMRLLLSNSLIMATPLTTVAASSSSSSLKRRGKSGKFFDDGDNAKGTEKVDDDNNNGKLKLDRRQVNCSDNCGSYLKHALYAGGLLVAFSANNMIMESLFKEYGSKEDMKVDKVALSLNLMASAAIFNVALAWAGESLFEIRIAPSIPP